MPAEDAFPVVLAADVLYERRDVEPLLALVERVVAPGGELWLAEPGRPPAARFLESMRRRMDRRERAVLRSVAGPGGQSKGVVVTIHRLRRR